MDELRNTIEQALESNMISVDEDGMYALISYIEEKSHSLVSYELATSSIWCVVAIALIVSGIILIKLFRKNKDWCIIYVAQLYGEDEPSMVLRVILYVIFSVMIGVGIIVMLAQLFDIVACITYPEKIVIDSISKRINSANNATNNVAQ